MMGRKISSFIGISVFAIGFLISGEVLGEQVFWGIEYWHETVSGPNEVYVMKVDLQAKGIRAFVTPELKGEVINTSTYLSRYGVQVGINTAFFDMGGTNRVRGFHKSNGVQYQDTIVEDWRPTVGFSETTEYLFGEGNRGRMYNACSGSHVIVENGQIAPKNVEALVTDRHPRTAVGIDKSRRYFYMVVVDGRMNSSVGMTLDELGQEMIRLGVDEAVNLDGGGSSTMVIQGKGLMNRPTGGTYQRPVASHLGFFANSTCEPSAEVCNHVDDDCDGVVDEDDVCAAEEDAKYQVVNYEFQNTDVDGDGKADICARGRAGIFCAFSSTGDMHTTKLVADLSDAKGWNDESNYATIQFADVNGDGKADLCARANVGIRCWLSKGTEFGEEGPVIPMNDADGYNDVRYYSTIRFADINGDGRDDACARFKDGYKCFLSVGDGSWGDEIPLNDLADATGWGSSQYYSSIRTGDVNGDGKSDVCARGIAGFRCWISQGDHFEADFLAAPWSDALLWGYSQYGSTIRMPDINGDGKADVCARDLSGISCWLSEGTSMREGEIRGPKLDDDNGWAEYDNYSTLRFGDVNGDGKDDLCIRSDARYECYLSTGEGFGEAIFVADMSNEKGWNQPNQFRTIRVGDINGDGMADVCGRNSSGYVCYLSTGTAFEEMAGPEFNNDGGWNDVKYYSTIRFGGPIVDPCTKQKEVCDGQDNNCNGEIDEGNVCCVPSEEVCDEKDNDCDGEVDEGGVCDGEPACIPSEEVCDEKDNDCDGEVDEGGVCDGEPVCIPSKEVCDNVDNDCDGAVDEGDVCGCELSEEVCDGKDNDCDGEIDEGGVCAGGDPTQPCEDCSGQDHDDADVDGEGGDVGSFQEDDCGCSSKGRETPTSPLGVMYLIAAAGWFFYRKRKTEPRS